MNEVWKCILGYEGIYMISNLGSVKSLQRLVPSKNSKRLVKEKILKQCIDSVGYLHVGLNKENKHKTFKIHKLVAIAFLNHSPCGYKIVVDHIDDNKLNNNANNLQLVSQRENASKNKKSGSSVFTGVNWHKQHKKWHSKIELNGKSKHLGYFETELEASKAYQKELKKL